MSSTSRSFLREPETEAQSLQCDHPGCVAHADHRAPKARSRLNDYYWFCLEHVREYNRNWNYYSGMSDTQVESEIRNDTVWRRPTWPFSSAGGDFGTGTRFRDDLGIFEAAASMDGNSRTHSEETKRPRPDAHVQRALRIMNFDGPVTLTELKSRYKQLVKRLHPDANGGDRDAEEKLKDINQAYATLKKFLVA